jgi:hypothetical protein
VNPTKLLTFDPIEALSRLDGDVELLESLFDVFRTECPRMLAALHDAVDSGYAAALVRAAHDFKGAVGNFSDSTTFEWALALEMMGHEGVLAGANDTLERLEAGVQNLEESLGAFLRQQRVS